MTCYTVTTCVISGGSIPSDKGGGGGGETQALPQDPPLLYRYSGFLVKFEVPGSVGLDRSSPLSFFSLWLSVDFNGTPTRG